MRLPDGPGFPAKDDNAYSLTPSTQTFLTTTSPAWIGSIVHFLCSPEMTTLFLNDPASFVRKGGSIGLGNLAPDHPAWVKFARAMVPFMRPTAGALADEVAQLPSPPKRVLKNVAATMMGHGRCKLRHEGGKDDLQARDGGPRLKCEQLHGPD